MKRRKVLHPSASVVARAAAGVASGAGRDNRYWLWKIGRWSILIERSAR